MVSLGRAGAAAAQQMDQQDDSSKSKKAKKGKSKKKLSSDDSDDQVSPFGPDITVSIGSGERDEPAGGPVRPRLALRLLPCVPDQRSFQEGAAGRVTLDVPSPQPSAAASRR